MKVTLSLEFDTDEMDHLLEVFGSLSRVRPREARPELLEEGPKKVVKKRAARKKASSKDEQPPAPAAPPVVDLGEVSDEEARSLVEDGFAALADQAPTLDDVRDATRKVARGPGGTDACRSIFAQFGVIGLHELKEEQWAQYIKACQAFEA